MYYLIYHAMGSGASKCLFDWGSNKIWPKLKRVFNCGWPKEFWAYADPKAQVMSASEKIIEMVIMKILVPFFFCLVRTNSKKYIDKNELNTIQQP